MPTIKLNKKVFEKLVGKKLPLEKLKDRISMLGTDLESIENNEITVEIFPNRPDMLSEQGFARAFSAFIGEKTGLRKYNVKKSGLKLIVENSVTNVRPYTACAIVKNLKFDNEKIKEIIQIQEKLHITFGRNRKKAAIGVYPLEKIEFPIKFIAEDPKKIKFRPLEYPEEIDGLKILSKHPAGRDYGYLLEGLKKFPIFIDANSKVLSMPPIINSHETGRISEKTKDVFIECSGFDFDTLKKCLNMIVTSLADMGGDIYSLDLIYKNKNSSKKIISPNLDNTKMKLDINYVNKRLGLSLKDDELKKLLMRMNYGYKKGNVLIPPYRTDILHPIDLVEDVAIAYGFENFNAEIPDVSTIGEEDAFEKFKNKVSNILATLNLLECETYNLSNKKIQNISMLTNLKLIELESAVNTEFNVLRAWMMPSIMEIFNKNLNKEYPQNLFGIGRIFKKGNSETGIVENDRVCVALCEDKADFTRIKQILDYLMRMLDLSYEIEETEHPSFIAGRVGRIKINKKDLAYIGEVHPQVLENFGLEMPVASFELNLTELFETIKK